MEFEVNSRNQMITKPVTKPVNFDVVRVARNVEKIFITSSVIFVILFAALLVKVFGG